MRGSTESAVSVAVSAQPRPLSLPYKAETLKVFKQVKSVSRTAVPTNDQLLNTRRSPHKVTPFLVLFTGVCEGTIFMIIQNAQNTNIAIFATIWWRLFIVWWKLVNKHVTALYGTAYQISK